ncbi:MAG: hypothetical protein GVY18_07540, partial [Bacteroidetes bacterium]|nr:hypothetical protein [Bacteroidota bacterium]
EVLAATDLVPFRAAIAAGVDLVMPGHLRVPALDPSGQIATLSAPMLHSVLRDELGFQGVVVTDSLLMAAVRDRYDTPAAQAAALLRAGVDLLLDPVDPVAMVDGIVEAVEDGRVEEARLDAAVGRVWRLKQRFAESHGAAAIRTTPSRPDGPAADHQLLADDVARNAIRVIAGLAEVLPLRPDAHDGTRLLAVAITSQRSAGDAEPPLLAGLRDHLPDVTTRCIGPDDEGALQALLNDAAAFDRVLVALLARPAAWQSYGLRPAQRQGIQTLTRRQPVVVAALGAPDLLSAFPDAALRLCTYSDVPASQAALVQALVGGTEIKGG